MDWQSVDSKMTSGRKKIKDLQTKLRIGNSAGCFKCEHWKSCYASIPISRQKDVNKGDWTYVGREYGEASVNGKKAKILFVSMDRGYSEGRCEKFEDTQVAFRTAALERSNQHMGGVDVELEHLLDEGTSPEIRCQQFALTNAVRCCPYSENASSKSTPTMIKNCASHTKAITQALEPDIIIAQGNPPRKSLRELFAPSIVEKYQKPPEASVEIGRGEIGQGKEILFLLTPHPAYYTRIYGFQWDLECRCLPTDELKCVFERAREMYSQG